MTEQNPFKWRHFQAEIILLCVRWLCCKNDEEIKRRMKPLPGFRLGDHSKQPGNQGNLVSHISFVHSLYLPFPYHIHHLKAL